MKSSFVKIIITSLFFGTCLMADAQDSLPKLITDYFNTYRQRFPAERAAIDRIEKNLDWSSLRRSFFMPASSHDLTWGPTDIIVADVKGFSLSHPVTSDQNSLVKAVFFFNQGKINQGRMIELTSSNYTKQNMEDSLPAIIRIETKTFTGHYYIGNWDGTTGISYEHFKGRIRENDGRLYE